MKYLIAATEPNLEARVHKRFGHADYYLVVDADTLEFTWFEGLSQDQPHHDFLRFLDPQIGAVITGNIGPNAFQDIQQLSLKVYSCIGLTVKEAIEKVKGGKISSLSASTMKHSIHTARQSGREKPR